LITPSGLKYKSIAKQCEISLTKTDEPLASMDSVVILEIFEGENWQPQKT